MNVSDLNGLNGFRIDGVGAYEQSGYAVSGAGDINGDGFDDFIIGAPRANPGAPDLVYSGSVYVVFGTGAPFPANFKLALLNGDDGFRLDGQFDGEQVGFSVSAAGDVNGDGFADFIIGAVGGFPDSYTGRAYVVFGNDNGLSAFDLSTLDGVNGFRLNGVSPYDRTGFSVSGAGDINGDGFDDVIIGARLAGDFDDGASYVVFGAAGGFDPSIDLSMLDGSNGFRIDSGEAFSFSGFSVSSAGDVNGDGFDDVIVGAVSADDGTYTHAGAAFVVFGQQDGFVPALNLSALDGSNGFRINGVGFSDYTGRSVSSAGDFNGDGFDDLIVGAPYADPHGNYSGSAYVIFGHASGFSAALNLADLTPDVGFRIHGTGYDYTGFSVSGAGDINGDGFDDLIVGAWGADPDGNSRAGSSYIIFGFNDDGTPGDDVLVGTQYDDAISGFGGNDTISGLGGDDILNGDDGDDVLDGGSGDDTLSGGDGDDTLKGGPGTDILDGGAGNDTVTYEDAQSAVQIDLRDPSSQVGPPEGLDTLISIENVIGSNFGDSLTGDDGDNVLSGGGGMDFLTGFGGNDTLLGGAGNDIFMDGGAGDDIIDGGAGVDQVTYAGAGSAVTVNLVTGVVTGGLGNDTLNAVENVIGSNFNDTITGNDNNNALLGQNGNDTIVGNGGDDTLNGGAGNDNLQGGAGNDSLIGAAGNDTLNGGSGIDTANYGGAGSGVIVNLTTGQATGQGNDTLTAVENLTGSSFSDTLTGDANDNRLSGGAGNDTLTGGAGNDTLDGGADSDTANYAQATGGVTVNLNLSGPQAIGGGQGTDTIVAVENLTGSSFNDTLTGNAADNILSGGDGNDTLIGGDGNDRFIGGAGNDGIDGGAGVDIADYGSDTAGVKVNLQSGQAKGSQIGTDTLANIENVTGGSSDDQITADQSNNVLNGGGGNDKLNGHGGDDILIGGAGNDELKGGAGIDTANYQDAIAGITVSLAITTAQDTGGAGTDTLEDIENLIGGAGADHLFGNQLANVIAGGAGDDELRGAAGNDTLIGGDGADTIEGGAGADTLVLTHAGSIDSIIGYSFNDGDRIDLSALLDGSLINDDGSNLAHFIRLREFGGQQVLQLDPDGDQFGTDNIITVATFDTYVPIVHVLFDGEEADVLAPPQGSILYLGDVDGDNGFRIDGVTPNQGTGYSLSDAGDINGDGFDDLLIGAAGSDPNGASSFIVFGTNAGFPDAFAVSSLDGTNGFSIDGSAFLEFGIGAGVSAAGDVNSDGFDDIIIGSDGFAGFGGGSSYVIFGRADAFPAELDLSSLDGSNGFHIVDDANTRIGHSVNAAGDVNGDGFGDLIIGTTNSDFARTSYVVFGSSSGFQSELLLSSIDGSNGFLIEGISNYDGAGLSVSSAGDFNGDGFDDLLIGAPHSSSNGFWSGESYIVFGKDAAFSSPLELADLDGTNGFRISGSAGYDRAGFSVSAAGDINGDGFDDVIIGAFGTPNGYQYGASYVVFGSNDSFGSTFDVSSLDGSNGFRIDGTVFDKRSGWSVSGAGDFNGDGFDDLIIGAPYSDPNGTFSGSSYLVFGSDAGFPSALSLSSLDGSNGFRIDGTANALVGTSVSAAGDVNGDGFDDLVVGAARYSYGAGASYVIFGHATAAVADKNVVGSPAGERLIGGAGDDTLLGNGGADIFAGGAGNDVISVTDLDFSRADGGNGNDTLVLLGSGGSFDFTAFADSKTLSIEVIDVTGSGDNTLTLGLTDVLNMSDGRSLEFTGVTGVPKSIVIDGNAGDVLQLGGDARGEWLLAADGVHLDGSAAGDYDFYIFDPFNPGASDMAAVAVRASVSVFLV